MAKAPNTARLFSNDIWLFNLLCSGRPLIHGRLSELADLESRPCELTYESII